MVDSSLDMARILTILLRCAGAVLCVAPSAAQTLVVPGSHAGREGSGATNLPFGRPTPVRVQAAYDGGLFPAARRITALAWRPDGAAKPAAKRVEVEIRLSTMPSPLTWIRDEFRRNRGADETVALGRRWVVLPSSKSTARPRPFEVALALDRAFAYDPRKGPLLVEVVVHRQPAGAYPLDATWICDSPRAAYGPPGCGPAGKVLLADCPTRQVLWGKGVTLRLRNAPAKRGTMLFLGSIEKGTWKGIPIPIELSAYGAPGCWLAVDVLMAESRVADAGGQALYGFNVPSIPTLKGQWLRYQGAALAPAANALGVISSQARKVQVCGYEAVARVFATDTTATKGARELGVAPVLRITGR